MLTRLFIVLGLTAAGLGSVLLLPDQIRLLDSAVRMEWPTRAGAWVKVRNAEPSPQEISILARDTRFAKAQYMREGSNIPVDVGIVLSGDDINNSIHRPERCLVAQGHQDLQSSPLDLALANGRRLPAMRLSTRVRHEIQRTGPGGENQIVHFTGVTYYWFVAHDLITSSHYGRTFKDISDRLLRGTNQRWAYITVSVFLPETNETRPLVEAGGNIDRLLQDFISTLAPEMIDFSAIPGEPVP